MTFSESTLSNLMPIGRFSNACRLSVKALRHYDNVELLRPAFVDPHTGYRYYRPSQARDAVMIAMLRSLDMPLATIRSLLHADSNTLRLLLEQEQGRVANELARQQQILKSIERIALEGDLMPYDIGIRTEPDRRLASLTCATDAEQMVKQTTALMLTLFDQLANANIGLCNPCLCINQAPDAHGNITVHACVGTVGNPIENQSIEMLDIAGGPVAWLTHTGAYEQLGIAYHALFAWAQERGHEQRDALREIYLNDPADTATESLLTEVILPIVV